MSDKIYQLVANSMEIEEVLLRAGAGAFDVVSATTKNGSLSELNSCSVPDGSGHVLFMRDARGACGVNLLFPATESFLSSMEVDNLCVLVRGIVPGAMLPMATCALAYTPDSTNERREGGLTLLSNLYPVAAWTEANPEERVTLPGGFVVAARELTKDGLHFTRDGASYNFFFKRRQ